PRMQMHMNRTVNRCAGGRQHGADLKTQFIMVLETVLVAAMAEQQMVADPVAQFARHAGTNNGLQRMVKGRFVALLAYQRLAAAVAEMLKIIVIGADHRIT